MNARARSTAVSTACGDLTQETAVERARAFIKTHPDSSDYWLDSLRVESDDSAWFIHFRRRDIHNADGSITGSFPREGLFAINRRSGQVRRAPLPWERGLVSTLKGNTERHGT